MYEGAGKDCAPACYAMLHMQESKQVENFLSFALEQSNQCPIAHALLCSAVVLCSVQSELSNLI